MTNINDGSNDAKTSEILEELKNHLENKAWTTLRKDIAINMLKQKATYKQIGKVIGVCAERVRQIIKS